MGFLLRDKKMIITSKGIFLVSAASPTITPFSERYSKSRLQQFNDVPVYNFAAGLKTDFFTKKDRPTIGRSL